MADLSEAAGDPTSRNYSADTLRKVLQIFLVIWSALLFLSLILGYILPNALTSGSVTSLFVGLPYEALAFFGVVVILWAVQALRSLARVVVLCAGVVMILTTIWDLVSVSQWFQAKWSAIYGLTHLSDVVMFIVMFFPGILMALWVLLFAGGLLLEKKRRNVWSWIAGIAALLACAPVAALLIRNTSQTYSYSIIAFLLMAISTLCIAISLKRPKPTTELPSS